MITDLNYLLTVILIVAAVLTTLIILAIWDRRRSARNDLAILRVLAIADVPLAGMTVARLSGVDFVYTSLSRLEERGLVERYVDPPRTETIHGQTIEIYGLSWYTITDAGRAEVSPGVETTPYRS